jgi:hypothetical protein
MQYWLHAVLVALGVVNGVWLAFCVVYVVQAALCGDHVGWVAFCVVHVV